MQHILQGALLVLLISPILAASSLADMANRQQTEAIRTYIKENFGYPGMETSWYASIVSLSVEGK